MNARAVVCVSLLATSILAQSDPPAPPGGFAVVEVLDVDVTWSDGFNTRIDFYHPDTPVDHAWPVVLANHGSGGDRKIPDITSIGRYLASFGYTVYAFDGRGNGDTPALNPGWTTPWTQERVLLDQAESLSEAAALLPGLMDTERFAVTGISGGGSKAFSAVAWSGRPLPEQSHILDHPVVSAVAPEIVGADSSANAAPSEVLASDHRIRNVPATDPGLLALAAGDYASFYAGAQTTFNDERLQLLQISRVPVFAMVAAQDTKIGNHPLMDLLPTLTMPRRLFVSTGGHSTVKNHHERQVQHDMRRRWFDRFLKGSLNGVAREPYAEVAMQPSSNGAHADPATIWEHRSADQFPGAVAPSRLYLRAFGVLAPAAPPAAVVGPLVQHRVAPGFDVIDYSAQGAGLNPGALLAQMPKVAVQFDSAPLGGMSEILGRTVVELHVDDNTGIFQLSAMLTHVDPTGTEAWIAMGTTGVRDVPGRHVVTIELDDVGHLVPAGHFLRLRILNLADHMPPGGRRVRVVPYFTDTDSRIAIEPGGASFVEIPIRDYTPSLSPRLARQSVAAGIGHRMRLSGGPARAGMPYVTVFGTSGEAPGLSLPGLPHIPLNWDVWTGLSFAFQNTALFPLCGGLLDADGRAGPGLAAPTAPIANLLLGHRFTAVGLIFNGVTLEVAGPATIVIEP